MKNLCEFWKRSAAIPIVYPGFQMILLDTNKISEIIRADGALSVLDWANSHSEMEFYLCAPVVAEMKFGARLFLAWTGSKRYLDRLNSIIKGPYAGRVLPVTLESALKSGVFKAIRERAGCPVSNADVYTAGIAAAHGATLATRNSRDFEGLDLKLVNPFEA